MKTQNNLLKRGFSLIELSIVILVIGILIIGITKGTAIMTKTRLGSARALTSGSPVPVISDLVVWYESSLATSFNSSDQFDGTTLTNASGGGSWYDNSPNKNINATTVSGAVVYKESTINNLPGVNFSGGASSLAFNPSSVNQKDYTIFVVEQRRAVSSATVGRFLDLGGNTFGYSSTDGQLTMPPATGNYVFATGAFGQVTPRVVTYLASSTTMAYTKGIFVNGGNGTIAASAAVDTLPTVTSTGFIGKQSTSFYTGDICEIIIYNRALKIDERNDIQAYLGKKYAIKVATTTL